MTAIQHQDPDREEGRRREAARLREPVEIILALPAVLGVHDDNDETFTILGYNPEDATCTSAGLIDLEVFDEDNLDRLIKKQPDLSCTHATAVFYTAAPSAQ